MRPVKTICIAAASLGAFAALSLVNYRRFVPKPHAMGDTTDEVEARKLPIESGGHTLYGELLLPKNRSGKLPTIICSHGFNGSYRYFKSSVGMCLAMSGFAVYCFDFYGGSIHGKSGGKMTEMSVFTERDQLNDVITAIKTLDFVDLDNLFLWGESQGGFVTAITAAQHNEDVKGVVLFYPAFCAKDDIQKRYASLDEMPEIVDIFGKKVGKIYYEKLYNFDAYTEAAKYTGPVLIIHGNADRTVNVSYGQAATESYRNARLEVLPGEDHGFSGKGKIKATEMVYGFLREQLYNEVRDHNVVSDD